MTKREIASLVLKLIGVYMVVQFIGYFPAMFGSFGMVILQTKEAASFQMAFSAGLLILSGLLYLAGCVSLIVYSDKIAVKMVSEDKTLESCAAISKSDVLSIAFCCIGLLVLTRCIPQVIHLIIRYMTIKGINGGAQNYFNIGSLVSVIVQFIIGLWLFLGSKGIVFWLKLRGVN